MQQSCVTRQISGSGVSGMFIEKPNIAPLEQATQRLEEGLKRYLSDTSDDQIRDGLIQRFKFTYEQAHKALKRYLKFASANPEIIDQMTFQDVIRTGNEQHLLLGEWPDWRGYRELRAKTSHTDSEEMALVIVANIPRFLEEVIYLRDTLQERLA